MAHSQQKMYQQENPVGLPGTQGLPDDIFTPETIEETAQKENEPFNTNYTG